MARLRASVTTEGEIALTAATAKTILQLAAPANQILALRGFSVSFDGVLGTAEPVKVDLVTQTDAGTMSAATEFKDGPATAETIQGVALKTATVEPTTTTVLRSYNIHPQTGFERSYAFDEEIQIAGGARLGLRCTAPAAVNVLGVLSWEE